MQVAHHSSYVVWLEAARIEWMRSIGASYRDLDGQGVAIAVTGLHVRYRRAVRFDDEVAIDCRLTQVRSRRLTFAYLLSCASTGVVADAVTEHVPVDRHGKTTRLPASWIAVVSPHVVSPHVVAPSTPS